MSRLFRLKTTITTVCLLALPAVVWASGGGSGRNPWADLGFKAVNFSILVGGLFFILRKPIAQALRDRHEGVRKALEDARKAKETADAKAAEYTQRVANLDQEVEEIRTQVREEAERQKEQILAEAQTAAESIRRQAEAAGTNEVKRAQDTLRTEVVDLAVKLAEELLAKNYTADDQNKAVQMTIENVEGIH